MLYPPAYPGRLHHTVPTWVKAGVLFHIRIRAAPEQTSVLTGSNLVHELLIAARRYHELGHWWCKLFLIMPDHVHAMLAFPPESGISMTLRDWKRGTARFQSVQWQTNYFDHRIRNNTEANETWSYIRRNPVEKGLCLTEEDWPYWWSALTSTR
jgi:REP element-mobilizing transposase RayT